MADILTVDDLTTLVPDIDPAWATLYADAVNAEVAELAPSGVPATVAPRVKLLLLSAIQQAAMNKPWVASETTGPYAVIYRDGARPGGLLNAIELTELRRMLGLGVSIAGPVGNFPKVVDYDHLFAIPIQPTYIGASGVTLVVDPPAVGTLTGDMPIAPIIPTSPPVDDGDVVDLDSGVDQTQMDRL